ncbi:IclR family transcriptional regulator [Arthrobacter sp. SW1]|uniref:IclR family transcriptional regulator n=1 Tax=Arthrobacter sp. SW1 TaxID=1920889 RepID=UPI000877E3F3|nr:IclR family transcriptional regulator [Arthrobacter sp. SW1]OFI39610.1 IclR family transcriptional regulator [Arthrobacter sp. SW1]
MADSRTSRSADSPGGSSPAPAVTRAAAVLDALAAAPSGRLTLSDLSRELGIPKSSTSNLLLALEEARLITREGADFSLGRKLVELGAAYLSRLDEVQEFYKYCEQAPTLSKETVRVAMRDGDHVIYLARYEGHPAVRLTSNIGDKMPLSLCAVGKALLAQLHDHDIEEMFPDARELPVMTPKSLRSAAELKAQIAEIRRQGFAFEDEESTIGVVCLAVPVPTHGAHGPSLGLSVTSLKATYSDEQGAQMVKELKELAHSLGNPMG